MSFFNFLKVLLFLFFAGQLSAQPWFNWDYTGPDTIAVGTNCRAGLQWGGDSRITCTPVNPPGQVVISKTLKSISGGFFQGSLVPGGTTVTVVYEAKDNQGHTEQFSFTIYFADKTPPVFNPNSLPGDITITCASTLNQPPITATDNCTLAFQIQISSEVNFPPSPCNGVYQRTFTAKDQAGNKTTYVQNITLVGETIRPTITTEAQNSTNNCSVNDANAAFQQWISNHGGAVATDNCGIGGWSTIPANPTLNNSCNVPTTVTFVVSDFCGNKDSTTASFEIIDQIPPVLVSDAVDLITGCEADPSVVFEQWMNNKGGAVVTDNCVSEEDLLVTFVHLGVERSLSQLQDTLAEQLSAPPRSITINGQNYDNVRAFIALEFIIADYCNQKVSTQAVFALIDTSAPIIITVGLDTLVSTCSAGNIVEDFTTWYSSGAGGSAEDECGSTTWKGNPSLEEALDSLSNGPDQCNQHISIEFRAEDGSGNLSEESFISVFAIEDVSGPVFIDTVMDYQLVCGGAEGVQDSVQSWINRKGGAAIEDCNEAVWDRFEWLDSNGNSGAGQFDIGPYPQISGNGCDQFINVSFFAKDACDNFSQDSARFNLGDNESPVASAIPADTTIQCDSPVPFSEPSFTDNCGLAGEVIYNEVSTQNPSVVNCAHFTYNITRTWIATDECGNETIVTQVINVIDTLAPQPDMPLIDLDLDCNDDLEDYFINFSDNCSFVTTSLTTTSDKSADPALCEFYNYSVTQNFNVKDVCQNEKIYVRTIHVSDTTAPEIENSEPLILNCTDSTQIANIIKSLVSDNCANELDITILRLEEGNQDLCASDVFQKWLIAAEDPCGNNSEDTVLVNLLDNQPPVINSEGSDLTFYCGDTSDIQSAVESWILNAAGAAATDACGEVQYFVALEGSYDANDPATFPGILPQFSDVQSCTSGFTATLDIAIVFYDQCNNVSVSNATFSIQDTISPTIVFCPADTTIVSAAAACNAELLLNPPGVLDQCGSQTNDSLMTREIAVISENPGNTLTIVNDALVVFDGFLFNGTYGSYAPGGLTVSVLNADADGPGEFFNIYDENDNLLGSTNLADAPCGNSTTVLAYDEIQFNQWISDGVITFYIKPNNPAPQDGSFSINDICGGTKVNFSLPVTWNSNPALSYTYKIDTFDAVPFDPSSGVAIKLKEGVHQIIYDVIDCAGLKVTCTQNVTIRDTVPPSITCPADIIRTLSGNTCETVIAVPLPLDHSDNCGLSNDIVYDVPSDTASAWLTFAANPDLQNYLAQDKNYTFTGVSGNVTSPVLLNIFLKGDVESGGEYFTIYGEDGVVIGSTEPGPGNVLTGSCSKVSTIYFNIPAAKFNEWASDGSISFNAISNKNFSIPPGNEFSGINPCNPNSINADGQTDSTSFMFMQLKYSTYTPPHYFTTGATEIPLTKLAPPYVAPEITFSAGETYFSYVISDVSGNMDTCTFLINVKDTIPPEAICKNATLQIHPSGIIPGILTPEMIDAGSFDNCNIDTMYVSKSEFSCADIGSQPMITLYVVDNSGALDSCTTQISVSRTILTPSYSLGLCDNDSLRLFSNITDLDIFDEYVYEWSGPNNFVSNLANPVIPNATAVNSGTYKLNVTGFNGCGGEGFIQVFINAEINTPIIGALDSTVCQGSSINLFTQPYSGNIKYKWFEGFAPNGIVLDSTVVPQIIIDKPTGNYNFYVIISENDCISNPSSSLNVTVTDKPVAVADQLTVAACEGGSIILGSPLGTTYKYSWTGPNGFTSDLQYPPAITPAKLQDAGTYTLVVGDSECLSDPLNITVTVNKRPDQPTPVSNAPICTSNILRLTSNIINGVDSFIWKRPDGVIFTTAVNPFVIPSASSADNGLWTLTLKSGGCTSLESLPLNVIITQESEVIISYNGPVCEGDTVRLSTNPYPGATYKWTGPNGFTSTAINPLVVAAPGSYAVTVTTSAGCVASGNITLDLNIKPRITNLASNAHNCQFPEEPITFTYTSNIPEDELVFFWKGPGGYQNTEAHPVINPDQFVNGIYSLIVTSTQGCKSDTVRLTINISIAPPQPIIQGDSKLCSGRELTLTVPNLPALGQFIWSTPAGDVQTSANNLVVSNVQAINGGDYTVIFENNGCQSKQSLPFSVNVVNTPPQPVIIGDPTVCLNDSIILQISNNPDYVYQWTGPGGITSSQKKWVIHPAQASNAGNYFLTLVNDGCASLTSDAFQLIINLPPAAPTLAPPIGSLCVGEQDAVLTLCVTNGSATPGANYTFYNSALTTPVGGPTNGLCANITNFSSFNNGENNFYVIASLNTCPSPQSVPVSVIINYPPEEVAVTGKVKYACEGNSTTLSANTVTVADGEWKSLTPGVTIAQPTSPNTSVSGLVPGKNVFVWSLNYNDCIDYSRDTMIVWLPDVINAENDLVRMTAGGQTEIEQLVNDGFNTPIGITVSSAPSFGSAEVNTDQTLTYIPNGTSDYDKLKYTICVAGCPALCSEAEILIDVDNAFDCQVPNIITPNNDRVNDVLRISCLDDITDNRSKLLIFNEWGSSVYEASPYKNNWDGTYKGSDLPPGTYFYVFDVGDGSKVQKGFLIIKR